MLMKYILALIISVFSVVITSAQLNNAHVRVEKLIDAGYWKNKEVKYLDSAFHIINAAIKQYPDNIEIVKDYLYLARRYSYHDSLDKAENILKIIIDNYPRHWVCVGAYNVLGEVYMYQGDTTEAINVLSNSYNKKWPCQTDTWDSLAHDSLSIYLDKYISGQYIVHMLIKEERFEEALLYHNEVAEVLNDVNKELCGTVSDVENKLSRLRYYEIYVGLGDTIKAATYIIDQVFRMHWINYCIGQSNPYKYFYKLLRKVQTEERIKEVMLNAANNIVIQKIEEKDYYLASAEVYEKKVIVGALYNNGDVVNNNDMKSLDKTLSETELIERIRKHYMESCLYRTFTGEK